MSRDAFLLRQIGDEPPLLADGRKPPDRREVSLRWLSGTFMTAVTSSLLMGVALFGALEGREQLALPAEALASTDMDGRDAPSKVEKGSRLFQSVVASKVTDREIMEVSTMVRDGDRDVVRKQPFAHVRMQLAAAKAPTKSYPKFDPLKIFASEDTDTAPVHTGQIYGADVDSEISLRTVDFPLSAAGRPFAASMTLAEAEETVRTNGSVLTDGTVQLASLYYVDPRRFASAAGEFDFAIGQYANVRTENVSVAPMEPDFIHQTPEFVDDIIPIRKATAVGEALLNAGYDELQFATARDALAKMRGGDGDHPLLARAACHGVGLVPTCGGWHGVQRLRGGMRCGHWPEVDRRLCRARGRRCARDRVHRAEHLPVRASDGDVPCGRWTCADLVADLLDELSNLCGRGGTVVAILFKEREREPLDRLWHRHDLARRDGRLGDLRHQDRHRVRAIKGGLATEHLVEDAAERVDITATIQLLAAALLRAHVVWRAKDLPRARELRLGAGVLGDAEVEQLGVDVLPCGLLQEDVVWLEVAVDDVLCMRCFERGGDLLCDHQDLLERERVLLEPIRERHPLQKLHRQIEDVVLGLAEVEDGHAVGVVDGGRDLCFAEEAVDELVARDETWPQGLDGDLAVDAALGAFVDGAHASFTDFLLDDPAPLEDATEHGIALSIA